MQDRDSAWMEQAEARDTVGRVETRIGWKRGAVSKSSTMFGIGEVLTSRRPLNSDYLSVSMSVHSFFFFPFVLKMFQHIVILLQ